MRRYEYGNPAMIIEGEWRRRHGCFACKFSKRGEIDGKIRSYCELSQEGYPDNAVDQCQWGRRK